MQIRITAQLLIWGILFTAGFVTPWHNLEPAVMPKLAVLTVIVGLAGTILLLTKRKKSETFYIFNYLIIASLLLSLVNLVFNRQFFSERIFGVQGRNFGALTFVCLLILSLMSFQVSRSMNPLMILIALKLSSFVVAFYFLVQLQGFDRADWIDAYGGVPSSTLGNPNFVSAYVAIGFVSTLHLLIARGTKWYFRLLILTFSIFEIYVALESNSFQGLAIVILGCIYVFLSTFKVFLSKISSIKVNLIVGLSLSSIVLALAVTRLKGFLSIDNSSLAARLDYWEAGLAMGLDSPVFGKGFDFFGESYLMFRSERAAIRAPGLFTDSAHNYFIDILAFGGFSLFTSVLLLMILVIYSKFKRVFHEEKISGKNRELEKVNSGLFLAWLGFIFQALVNPFNIALAYLGFFLTGFLNGVVQNSESDMQSSTPSTKTRGARNNTSPRFVKSFALTRVVLLPSFLVIPILGLQPMMTDAKFRDGIEQGNGNIIYKMALSNPQSFQRMFYAVVIFRENQRFDLALPIVREMVALNPENIRGWRLLEQMSASDAEKREARLRTLALDPRNPQNKNN